NELAQSRLSQRLEPADRFIQNASLMLWPIWFSGDAAELPIVVASARRTHALDHRTINCYGDGRNPSLLNRARDQSHRLMAQGRCGNQQGRLDVVIMQTRDQVSHTLFDEYGSVGNEDRKS